MSDGRFRFRRAVVSDAPTLGELHVRIWRMAYAKWMAPAFLESLNESEWIADWRNLLSTDLGTNVVVAVDAESGDEIVGFSSAGPSRDAAPIAETELYALNIDFRYHGCGLAGRLLDAVLFKNSASLWVVEQNEHAQTFYRRHGFRVEGAKRWHAPSGVYDIRMVRTGIEPADDPLLSAH